jgi:hypothetical protein
MGLGTSFAPATSTAPIEWFLPSVVALGGTLLREDGTAAFAGPATERMLAFTHDLVHRHRILSLDAALAPSDDVQSIGIAGNLAQYFQGSHRLTTMQERSPAGAQWSLVPFPAVEDGKPTPISLQAGTCPSPVARGTRSSASASSSIGPQPRCSCTRRWRPATCRCAAA